MSVLPFKRFYHACPVNYSIIIIFWLLIATLMTLITSKAKSELITDNK